MLYASLDDWIHRETIPFSIDSFVTLTAAVDRVIASLDPALEVLGFGETLHGGEDILMLRNRLFQHLVEKHGYSAIAIESSFPRSHAVNEYVAGCGSTSSEAVFDTGFSHGFGQLEANRELVDWMRQYNFDPAHSVKLQFYGFDSPTEMMSTDSPRQLLHFVLDYLTPLDRAYSEEHRQRVDALLGQDAEWESTAAMFDYTQAIGLSPAAAALRVETEDLISELHERCPEWVEKSDLSRYLEAVEFAVEARQLLNYHAELARNAGNRVAKLLGIRDAMAANNLMYIADQQRGRGKTLAFAHNSHLKREKSQWQLGPDLLTWWPVGAHLNAVFGSRYAVIGSALGVSDANGLGRPESDTLESRLTATPGPVRFIPTHKGQGLPAQEIAALPTRSGSQRNSSYFPLTAQCFTDFDWLAILDTTRYSRGGPSLPE